MESFQDLSGTQAFLFYLGCGSFLFWAILTIASVVMGGVDSDADFGEEADFDADGDDGGGNDLLELFTIRNGLSFFTGLSWFSLAAFQAGFPGIIAIPFGAVIGVLLAALNMMILRWIASLAISGNVDLRKAIGHTAKVVVLVPANSAGTGKVSIIFDDYRMELLARTEGADAIRVGRVVKVVGFLGDEAMVQPVAG